MTVQNLFNQIGFEGVMNALQNTHRNEKSLPETALYKQAFDNLSTLAFSGNGGEVTFDVTPKEHWFDEGCLPMLANGVEGDLWENIVGKEVVKPEENPFTDAELAGAILWGATFYGFTSYHKWQPHEIAHNKYGERAKELERRLYRPYIRDKRTIRRLKSDELPFGIAFPIEVWNLIHIRQAHQNRHKRKRFYRLKKRIRHYKHLDVRAHDIAEIEHKTGVDLGDLKDRIMNAGSIDANWRECHVAKGVRRVEYAIDLMSNYFPTVHDILGVGEESIIVLYTSVNNKLKEEERKRLCDYFQSLHPTKKLHIFEAVDDKEMSDLGIKFLNICAEPIEEDEDDDEYA